MAEAQFIAKVGYVNKKNRNPKLVAEVNPSATSRRATKTINVTIIKSIATTYEVATTRSQKPILRIRYIVT